MQGDNDTLIRCILIHCWWPLIRELSLTDSFLSGTCRELVSLDLEVERPAGSSKEYRKNGIGRFKP